MVMGDTSADPVTWDRTIWRGTDHEWTVRKKTDAGAVIIPTEARAQVRQVFGGTVYVECGISIDPVEGWVSISIPEAATIGPEWDNRTTAVWDLECVYSGKKHRWVMGSVMISQDATREEVTA